MHTSTCYSIYVQKFIQKTCMSSQVHAVIFAVNSKETLNGCLQKQLSSLSEEASQIIF